MRDDHDYTIPAKLLSKRTNLCDSGIKKSSDKPISEESGVTMDLQPPEVNPPKSISTPIKSSFEPYEPIDFEVLSQEDEEPKPTQERRVSIVDPKEVQRTKKIEVSIF